MSPTPTKARALKSAGTAQRALNAAEDKALHAARVRDAAIIAAQTLGATYAEIEQVTDLSTSRVTQILRRERETRTA